MGHIYFRYSDSKCKNVIFAKTHSWFVLTLCYDQTNGSEYEFASIWLLPVAGSYDALSDADCGST